jgi:hypothetical protein
MPELEQALQTKYQATKYYKRERDNKCSLCQSLYETIDHYVPAYSILAK